MILFRMFLFQMFPFQMFLFKMFLFKMFLFKMFPFRMFLFRMFLFRMFLFAERKAVYWRPESIPDIEAGRSACPAPLPFRIPYRSYGAAGGALFLCR